MSRIEPRRDRKGAVSRRLESQDNKIEFYEQMGFEIFGEAADGETFRCVRMEKEL